MSHPTPLQFDARCRYQVVNETKGTTVVNHARAACDLWTRGVGLMGRRTMATDEAVLFPRCGSLHTCFMRMPIDVVVLDAEGTALQCLERLRPWRWVWPRRRAWMCIELYPGALAQSRTGVGDHLRIMKRA